LLCYTIVTETFVITFFHVVGKFWKTLQTNMLNYSKKVKQTVFGKSNNLGKAMF